MIYFYLLIIIVSIAMQAFFAGSEMGVISSNMIKVSHRAVQGDRRAKHLEKLIQNPERLLATTLVGVNIAVVAGSSMAASITSAIFDTEEVAAAVSTAVMLPMVLIFGQIVPMTFARKNPTYVSLSVALPLKYAYYILFPFVFLAGKLADVFSGLFWWKKTERSHFVTREELKLLIKEGLKKGVVDDMVTNMAYEIFDFGQTSARDVMVPLKRVVSCSKDAGIEEMVNVILSSGYSQLPVYGEWTDNIIGVAKATDLLAENPDKKALDVMRPCYMVRQNELLEDVLKEMQRDKANFAIVSDSSGRIKGIVTLEDIIEEIIGEIEDEYAPKAGLLEMN